MKTNFQFSKKMFATKINERSAEHRSADFAMLSCRAMLGAPVAARQLQWSPKMLLACLLALLAGAASVFAQAPTKPDVGGQAPLISGQTQDGKTWKLADAIGKKVVLLYFYPKDDTPGCTKEACGLRDRMADLHKLDVEVIGVSFDNAESHQKFIAKHSLNFTLLTDSDGKIADAYGVRVAGKNVARRVSFLIGKDGKILHVTDAQSADTHLSEMSDAVAKLK